MTERSLRRWLTVLLFLLPVAGYGALIVWAVEDATGFSLLFCEHPAGDSNYGDPVVGPSGIDCRWSVSANEGVVGAPDAPEATRTMRRPAFPMFRWVAAASGLAALVLAIKRPAGQHTDR